MAPSLFKAVEPREDVLEGTLSEAIFAASLEEGRRADRRPPSTATHRHSSRAPIPPPG